MYKRIPICFKLGMDWIENEIKTIDFNDTGSNSVPVSKRSISLLRTLN